MQQLDEAGLASWAAENQTAMLLLVRPGDYIFPGAPIALMLPPVEGAGEAIRNATALGAHRVSSFDLRFAVRQLVEVAVRALSPGVNDPHTAISVLDRLGAALCEMEPVFLRSGVSLVQERVVLVVPHIQYDQLLNTMFHMIRQNAAGNAAVLMRQLEVLTQVVSYERDRERMICLKRHADLVIEDAERDIATPGDLEDLRRRYRAFVATMNDGPLGWLAS